MKASSFDLKVVKKIMCGQSWRFYVIRASFADLEDVWLNNVVLESCCGSEMDKAESLLERLGISCLCWRDLSLPHVRAILN